MLLASCSYLRIPLPHSPSITTFGIANTLQRMAFVSYTVRKTEIDSRTLFIILFFHYLPFSSHPLLLRFGSATDVQYQPSKNSLSHLHWSITIQYSIR
jgi:hypothetical protein